MNTLHAERLIACAMVGLAACGPGEVFSPYAPVVDGIPQGADGSTQGAPDAPGGLPDATVAPPQPGGPCVDECNLDETRTLQGKTQTCRLFSTASHGPVPLSGGMHDRARRYNAWIRRHHLPEGALNSARFTDTTYKQVASFHGMRDSALFTGAYAAAEALRVKATGSPDAQANLRRLVETIHRLFEISGYKGVMARYAAPLGGDPKVAALYDPKNPEHHKATYKGQACFWDGNASRDAHQGPLLAYALAYPVLTSEPHRQMIRKDIVDLCLELLKERQQLTVTVRFKVGGTWIKLPLKMNLQYVVLNPAEFVDGSPAIQLGSDDDALDYGASTVTGMREFFPDYSVVVKQVPLLSSVAAVPIIRSGSTVMLASILRLGMLVSSGVPEYAGQNATISAHYKQRIGDWTGKMKLYTFLYTKCWEKYYGLNITFMPIYNLIQLENDPTLRGALQTGVLDQKMWPYVKGHKNPLFTLIHASHAPATTAQAEAAAARAQLALFPSPPNAERQVDNSAKYPLSTACDNQVKTPVDVSDRNAAYFLWERHPFYAKSPGTPQLVYPGADYLLAYWLGRAHGLLANDVPGTCLRWQ